VNPKVFFTDMRAAKGQSLLSKLEKLVISSGILDGIEAGNLTAVKLHFGERGNLAFIRPQYIRKLVDMIKEKGGKPFLTDSCTLYAGSRGNAVDHLETAILNGFDYAVTGAPLIIADGLTGKDSFSVPVNLKHFKEVKIAGSVYCADKLITVSHFKGTSLHSFGGALKNLGMGLASRAGKLQQHSDVLPQIDPEKCRSCSKCLEWCPSDAIVLEDKARILEDKCIGCGECTITCPHKAIAINWKSDLAKVQEKTVEYAAGALKGRKGNCGFITFVTDISPLCDCFSWNDVPIVPDIGILASKDPVAIDQAALDLVSQAPGDPHSCLADKHSEYDKFKVIYPEVDGNIQLVYAEEIGLGSRQYELIRLG